MQKHTKQLIAAVALLLIAAVPLALHIANADPTDEAVASAAASSSEAQAEAPVSSSAASAADSTSEPEPQPEEEPDASSEEVDSSAESGDASASSSGSSRFLEARIEPRRFFEARCTFGGVVPRGIVLAFGRFVSCGVVLAFGVVFDIGLVCSSHTTETTDAKVNAYVRRLRNLQKRSSKKLYQTASSAYSEYMEHPVEERNLALKVSIVLGKTMELTKLQSECDKEFKEIVTELRQYLRENGYDQSIADAAEKEYKEEKDAMIKELTNVTYSQVTGKGEGGKWLQEHADMGQ